ncbi:MAG: polysaccharide lyase family 8 super-sandwich domain-containing protein, partial [Bacteroidota bacterium]
MKNRYLLLLLLGLLCTSAYTRSDIDVVRQRVVSEILTYHPDDGEIDDLVRSLREDGSWPGINYEDVSNTGFEHTVHLRNMVEMSVAFSRKTSRYYQDQNVKGAISSSLGFWCDHDFICENWWHNQIGTPSNLVTVLLVMDNHLDRALVQRTLEIAGRANLDAGGARPGGDRIKIGGIEAKAVLVAGDEARFEQVMKVINDEIRFNTGQRGMQHDFSFHHRVDRVNNTCSYGLGYADAFAEWAVYVAGTRYAFEKEKIRL